MLTRSLRLAAVSFIAAGSAVGFSAVAHAQTETTAAAAAATETTTPAAAATETTVAAPTGAVAAGGGFLSENHGGPNPLPYAFAIVLAGGAGTALVVRRRRA